MKLRETEARRAALLWVSAVTHITGWRDCHHIAGVCLYYWPSHLSKLPGSWIAPLSLQTSFSLFYFIPFLSSQSTSLTRYWLEVSNADLISVTFLGRRLSYFITWTWKCDKNTKKFDVELEYNAIKMYRQMFMILKHFGKFSLRIILIQINLTDFNYFQSQISKSDDAMMNEFSLYLRKTSEIKKERIIKKIAL